MRLGRGNARYSAAFFAVETPRTGLRTSRVSVSTGRDTKISTRAPAGGWTTGARFERQKLHERGTFPPVTLEEPLCDHTGDQLHSRGLAPSVNNSSPSVPGLGGRGTQRQKSEGVSTDHAKTRWRGERPRRPPSLQKNKAGVCRVQTFTLRTREAPRVVLLHPGREAVVGRGHPPVLLRYGAIPPSVVSCWSCLALAPPSAPEDRQHDREHEPGRAPKRPCDLSRVFVAALGGRRARAGGTGVIRHGRHVNLVARFGVLRLGQGVRGGSGAVSGTVSRGRR